MPSETPASNWRAARRDTIHQTCPAPAPSARRTPSSRVRCVTACAVTPYIPTMTRPIARDREEAEHRRKDREQSQLLIHRLIERHHTAHERKIRIDGAQRIPQNTSDSSRAHIRAHQYGGRWQRVGGIGPVQDRFSATHDQRRADAGWPAARSVSHRQSSAPCASPPARPGSSRTRRPTASEPGK